MRYLKPFSAGITAIALVLTGAAFADEHIMAAVKTRQDLMKSFGANMSVLGKMARGKIEYDAEAAQKAATTLAALVKTDQSTMWPEGSDNFELGTETRAMPELWSNLADAAVKNEELVAAAAAMEGVAGTGLDGLSGAMRGLGGACGACHKLYRAPKE